MSFPTKTNPYTCPTIYNLQDFEWITRYGIPEVRCPLNDQFCTHHFFFSVLFKHIKSLAIIVSTEKIALQATFMSMKKNKHISTDLQFINPNRLIFHTCGFWDGLRRNWLEQKKNCLKRIKKFFCEMIFLPFHVLKNF